jgi:hypothetical protein
VTPEYQIQHDILVALGSRPDVMIWRQNTLVARDQRTGRAVRSNPNGVADILGCLAPSGRMLAIEVKSANGRQTTEQHAFQKAVEARGGLYVLARSVTEAVGAVDTAVAPRPA